MFDGDRYFDVFIEYAKADVEDILVRISIINRSAEPANLRVLPTIWFRNIWSWSNAEVHPLLRESQLSPGAVIELNPTQLGRRWLYCEGSPELLFTENETNFHRLFGVHNRTRYVKDGINDYIVGGVSEAVNPEKSGTKAAAYYALAIPPGATTLVRLRLTDSEFKNDGAFTKFDRILTQRQREADEFYATIIPQQLSADAQGIMRQGFAGMLWSKQFYHYVVKDWLQGDQATLPLQLYARRDAIGSGHISTMPMSFQCPTNGNTRGTRHGTWHFTVFP